MPTSAASARKVRVGAAAGRRDRLHARERQMADLTMRQAMLIEEKVPGAVYSVRNTCGMVKSKYEIIFNCSGAHVWCSLF